MICLQESLRTTALALQDLTRRQDGSDHTTHTVRRNVGEIFGVLKFLEQARVVHSGVPRSFRSGTRFLFSTQLLYDFCSLSRETYGGSAALDSAFRFVSFYFGKTDDESPRIVAETQEVAFTCRRDH